MSVEIEIDTISWCESYDEIFGTAGGKLLFKISLKIRLDEDMSLPMLSNNYRLYTYLPYSLNPKLNTFNSVDKAKKRAQNLLNQFVMSLMKTWPEIRKKDATKK